MQASVLDLYDSLRVAGPKKNGEDISWTDLEAEVAQKLMALQTGGKEIVLLTQTFASPSTSKLISDSKKNMEMYVM